MTTPNHLYYGDNLTILRERIADESVDLVYLDPPFNSNRSYNVIFKSDTGPRPSTSSESCSMLCSGRFVDGRRVHCGEIARP